MPSSISYRLKRLKRSVFSKLALLSPRFIHLLATPTPLLKIEYPGAAHSKTLIAFLPGIDDLAEDFERRGIIDDMHRQRIMADAIAVDAHYGYYAARALFERMADDVIFSAHAAGYEQLWLAGISLGGFGATLYAAHHAQQIDGMILLAPYLGKESLIQEIEEAGGIQNWNPGDFPEGDTDRTLWAWFKTYSESNEGLPPIYLGYGKSDKFARANAMLAEILPPSHVFAIEGGHDWRTWKKIWRHFLTVWKIERH